MPIDKFFKGMPDGIPKASFVEPILQVLADPFKKSLPENLQFFPANCAGLGAQPFELGWGQALRDHGINLISLFVA
jgi:hypothetical protein